MYLYSMLNLLVTSENKIKIKQHFLLFVLYSSVFKFYNHNQFDKQPTSTSNKQYVKIQIHRDLVYFLISILNLNIFYLHYTWRWAMA